MSLSLRMNTIIRGMALFAATSLLLASVPAMAITYGHGTYGACQYGSCSISIGSNSSVALNVTPTSGGSCTIQKDTVSVLTDNSSGFTLSFTDSSTNTALLKGASSISSTSATKSSPSTLSNDTWGYRVDGVGGFGSGPTSAQTNVSSSSLTFGGVPASNATPDVIATTSSAANPAVNTDVWYGVCADTSVTSGTYTTQVTYTAVAN